MWVERTPRELADLLVGEHFPQAFEWSPAARSSPRGGAAARTGRTALGSPHRVVVMVPTERHQ